MSFSTLQAGSYTIDPSHTEIGFVARHAVVTKVRGKFLEFDGAFEVAENIADSSATVNIQVNSVTTGNDDRDGHLRTGDFFEVEKFPTISFRSTNVVAKGDVLEITGDLTVKDTTKAVTIPFEYNGSVTDPWGNTRVGFEGETVVERKDWGLEWNVPLNAGGLLVSEKVTLRFDVSATKNA